MKAQWENEKAAIGKVQQLREQIEQMNADIERAEQQGDYEKAAKLKYGSLPEAQKQLQHEEKLAQDAQESNLLRGQGHRGGDRQDRRAVDRHSRARLVEGEREKLLHLGETLHKRVVGQDEAVTSVSEAILRRPRRHPGPNRPIGSFLFLGPTGVGKTEMAKALAESLFDDEKNLIRIDMTEYRRNSPSPG